MDKHDVNISIPPSDQSSDIVKVSGVENKVVRAIAALEDKVKELEEEKKDKVGVRHVVCHNLTSATPKWI